MGTKAPYQTKQMKQILAYLQTIEGTHVTAADVCSYFKEQGINVGTTTVYRNLEGHHCYHCKCEKCGKLIHLHCEDVVKLEQHLMDSHGFRMDPCRTVFYGICEECRGLEDDKKETETVHIRAK